MNLNESIHLKEKICILSNISDSISFEYDISSDTINYSNFNIANIEEICTLHHYFESLGNGVDVLEDDFTQVNKMCELIRKGEKEIVAEFRTNIWSEEYRWIKWNGRTIFDAEGVPKKIIGWAQFIEKLDQLILDSIETMENQKDDSSALYNVLKILGVRFNVDGVMLVENDSSSISYIAGEWSNQEANPFLHAEKQWQILNNYFDKEGFALIDVYKNKELELQSTNIKNIFAIKKGENTDTYKMLIFVDCKKNRVWTTSEKKAIEAIFYLLITLIEKRVVAKEKEILEQKIQYDSVTGLQKSNVFKEEAEWIVSSKPELDYAIIYSGFHNFQFVNDTYGYAIGDAILNRFGKFLQEELRSGKSYARVTGDQFVCLVRCDNLYNAKELFTACCKRFCNSMERDVGITNLIITSGISYVRRDISTSISTSMDNANLARKSIKEKAETNCQIFLEELRLNVGEKMRVTANMTKAMENEEFHVYLQPKVDLLTNCIVGAEALVRWIGQDKKIIPPDAFIPIFEENGFVTQIDFYVLQKVLIYLVQRIVRGLPVVPISVNFSRRHQDNPQFVPDILALLKEYGVPCNLIEVEVTESVFMSDISKLHKNIEALKANNILISIDDFGSGYSSLNVLGSVSADIIKIDKVFLDSIDSQGKKILKHLVPMIKELGFKTIAEGVETIEQVHLLQSIGCEMAQGYFYARPMPIKEFEEFYKTFNCKLEGE